MALWKVAQSHSHQHTKYQFTSVWPDSHISILSVLQHITVWLPTEKKHRGNHSPDLLLHSLSPPILLSPSFTINVTILGLNPGTAFSSESEFSQQQNWLNCWSWWFYSIAVFMSQSPSWNEHLSIFPSGERIFPLEMLEWHCGGWKNKLKLLCVTV